MLHKVEIAPEAAKEIEDLYLYVAQASLENAARWYFAIHDRCRVAFESRFYSRWGDS